MQFLRDGIKGVAYQASRGLVSEFIHRYKDNNQQGIYDQLTAGLNIRFSEVTDAQHAIMLLRNVHKKPGELVQVYSERLLILADDAYPHSMVCLSKDSKLTYL